MLQQDVSKSDKRCTAIMLAAGKGLRIGGDVRKQYLEIGGEPLLLHSVRTMAEDPLRHAHRARRGRENHFDERGNS